MSSASVDFKFAIDMHKTGSGPNHAPANWPPLGRLAFTFGSGDSEGDPPAPWHTPIFCYTVEPDPFTVVADYNAVIAAFTDSDFSGVVAEIVARFGQGVADDIAALCIDPESEETPPLTDAGWAMYYGIRARHKAQQHYGKLTLW
jgi:hypothetical protein